MTGVASRSPNRQRGRDVDRAVAGIIEAVRRRGDAAVRELTLRFDGVKRRSIEVNRSERERALRVVDPETRRTLRNAARRIERFARSQKRSLRPFRWSDGGVLIEQRLLPVGSVGVYVPGGRYPLCSTVLMGVIPARVAGCRTVVLCTPPRKDGSIAPEILAAAGEAGVDRVFACGGAQAIAALAHGTRTIPPVDLIVGPGNRFVATAKRQLSGRVGIDFVAGPTELLVIVDRTSDAELVAADLLSQAEHDPEARLWLVTVGRGIDAPIRKRLREMTGFLPAPNRRVATRAVRRMRVIRCASSREAASIANREAPEHLSVQTRAPLTLVPHLTSYGSLFLGRSSAIAFGDYITGPNHILPTDGAARHSGGLSVQRFLRVVTVQQVGPRGVRELAAGAKRLAMLEGLEAHRVSVALRDTGRPLAVLFDFDGVLVDSETWHWRAFREVLAPLGIELPRAVYDRRYLPFDDRSALGAMLRDGGISPGLKPITPGGGTPSIARLMRRKQEAFQRLSGGGPRMSRKVASLVRGLSREVPLAIVSGAAREEILYATRGGGVLDSFRTIVAAGDVRHCKPHPEGYLLALRSLGLDRGAGCVAVEDSPGGIRAARAAGCEVVGVATTYPASVLRRAGASRVVSSIARLRPAVLMKTGSRR